MADSRPASGPAAWALAIRDWADRVQRRYSLFGYPYAVVKKYGEDRGARQAALITYYGFLSVFPLLLMAVWIVSRVLVDHQDLRSQLIEAIVPEQLRQTVDDAVAALPTSTVPLVIGLVGLLLTGLGVVYATYDAINHLAGVPYRERFEFVPRYLRILLTFLMLVAGAIVLGLLTVWTQTLPNLTALSVVSSALAGWFVASVLILLTVRLLLARRVRLRVLVAPAVLGGTVIAVVLLVGAPLVGRFIAKAGPVYGSFATIVGLFSLLYLNNQGLMFAAEAALVRRRRLWPRALDSMRPTEADVRAYTTLARSEERTKISRISLALADSPPEGPVATQSDGEGDPPG